MTRPKILFLFAFLSSISYGETVKCYHCYESYMEAPTLETLNEADLDSKFVRCDKNKNNWNTWNCPARWPVCIIMSGKVLGHYEVVRSCAEEDFCSKYVPPHGVQVQNCRECNSTLCNDYPRLPDPPLGPDPLYTFNVNINLTLNKYSALNNEDVP